MKVLLLGAPRPLHLNRWKDDIAEAGEALGWEVNHVPARDIPVDEAVRLAKGCDALIWARTHGHDPVGDIGGMLRRIEDAGTVTVALHLDLYWGVPHRERHIGRHPWWSCQHVFTADGGVRAWRHRGVNHRWLPPPMGSRYFGRVEPVSRYSHRIAFVGGLMRQTHGPHRAQLLSWARHKYRGGFARYGYGKHGVWGAELGKLYASTRFIIGDSAPAPHYWSDRVPCTLGRGGVLAHPRTAGFAELGFTEDTMILFDRFNFSDLGRQIDALTLNPRRHRELSDNALDLIASRHMWTHRLLDIEAAVCGS